MHKFALHVLIFLLGILLAFALVFRPHFDFPPGSALVQKQPETAEDKPRPHAAPRTAELKLSLPKARPSSTKNSDKHTGVRRVRRPLSAQERRTLLINALRDGTPDSLEQLRPEYLDFLPDYQTQILPMLRRQVLLSLLDRFSDQDWLAWDLSGYANDNRPTLARAFIDDLFIVNPELGRYSETAALLFTGMYTTVMSGEPYGLEEDLHYILQNAERLLPKRRPIAVPARLFLEPAIIRDPDFLQIFEKLRSDFTARYIEQHQAELDSQLQLLLAINPAFTGSRLEAAAEQFLRRAVFAAAPGWREKPVLAIAVSPVFLALARSSAEVRRALSGLILVSALDAVEAGNRDRARKLVEVCSKIDPENGSLGAVSQIIERKQERPAAAVKEPEAESEPQSESRRSALDGLEESFAFDGQRVVIMFVLLGAVGFVGLRLFLLYGARKRIIGEEPGFTPEGHGSVLTSPSDIDFSEESELRVANR